MAGKRYRGLLIGNDTFPRDPSGLPALAGPLVDIQQLQQALTDDEVGLFSPGDLPVLPNKDVQELRERVDEFFSTATREDALLLYYSGHGELDGRNVLYLCARDTRTASLRATALSSIELNNMIDSSPATTIIIVLDCCHSGAFKGADLATPIAGRGRYVLTSSRATQLTRAASNPGQPSPFTEVLVHGLRHAEAHGHLTVADLYRHVHNQMTNTISPPQLRIVGEGDVIIARRGNQPLPMSRQEPDPVDAMPLVTLKEKYAGLILATILAFSIIGIATGSWSVLAAADATRNVDPSGNNPYIAFEAITIVSALICSLCVALIVFYAVMRTSSAAVLPAVVAIGACVVSGTVVVFAVTFIAQVLKVWMSPVAADWTSLGVISAVFALAIGLLADGTTTWGLAARQGFATLCKLQKDSS